MERNKKSDLGFRFSMLDYLWSSFLENIKKLLLIIHKKYQKLILEKN
jgi:hypothetical protein